ncbi:uncharacterized protein LOC26535939 [Drosophila yakuba]|uniref:uncharacterized protein LOC26535939 n=1 Tax=Drosophila yakuba TaxID=7245 RepID=UPI00193081A9|nr:uncharacterized protein LOC26535939 [Drosophila yakuba]XP_039230528.1 uncharacterized protein LOC26535939 [Drosophila yakuba]XP_039230529.1 uncharacterized protein LOC26535939 [Drosophila yakuba]XP_039230530.1 uncharacterized protein LOC26535939 [Drosophila yakuba]
MELNNLKVFELWISSFTTSEFELAIQKDLAVPISPEDPKKIQRLFYFLNRNEASYTNNRFAKRNSIWLSGIRTFAEKTNLEPEPSTSQGLKRGRPTKSLEESCELARRRKLQETTQHIHTRYMSQALSTKYEKDQDKTRAQLRRVETASPEELQRTKENISGPAKLFSTSTRIHLDDKTISEGNMFMASVVPLRLRSDGSDCWKNPRPSSVHYCRPKYAKETRTLTDIEGQISEIKPTDYRTRKGRSIKVQYEFVLTMVDGKDLNVLTDTKSTWKCAICHKNKKDFKSVDDSNKDYRLRTLEFIFKLAYQLPRTNEHFDEGKRKKKRSGRK